MVMLKTSPKHRGALFLANKKLSLVSQPLPLPIPLWLVKLVTYGVWLALCSVFCMICLLSTVMTETIKFCWLFAHRKNFCNLHTFSLQIQLIWYI